MGETAEKYALGSLPYFIKTISRVATTKNYSSYLPFPKEFIRQQSEVLQKEVTMKMARKKWQLKVGPAKNGTMAFRGLGWSQFADDNKLVIGDQVVFTMLNGGLFTAKIIRADGSDVACPRLVAVKQEVEDEYDPPEVEKVINTPATSAPAATVPDPEERTDETPNKRSLDETPSTMRPAATVPDPEEHTGETPKKRSLDETPSRPAATVPDPDPEEHTDETPKKRSLDETPSTKRPASSPADEETETVTKKARTVSSPTGELNRKDVEVDEPGNEGDEVDEEAVNVGAKAVKVEATNATVVNRVGTEEEPLVLDLSGESRVAGIHLLLRTEDRKEYKVFISASAVQSVAANAAEAPPVTSPEPATAEAPAAETPAPAEVDVTEEEGGEQQQGVEEVPRITIPIKVTNLVPYTRLGIEKAFAVKWMPHTACNVTLVDTEGTEWPVKWTVGMKRTVTTGWSALVKHYNLKMGDLCTLEIVEPTKWRVTLTDDHGRLLRM